MRKSSPQGTLRHSLSSPIETQNSSGIQPSLPIELDAESANGKKLMAAVCGFSATMASHIETYVTEQSAMFCFMINFTRLFYLVLFTDPSPEKEAEEVEGMVFIFATSGDRTP